MNQSKKSFDLRKISLVFSLIGLLLLPAVGVAQQGSARSTGYYPEGLSGQGCIDGITAKTVVIDDAAFELAAGVTFYKLKTRHASRSLFGPGTWVGFITNSQNQIEALWYLRSCE
jgi:hypothetical protein